jgi:microcystin degradation protein MlrC
MARMRIPAAPVRRLAFARICQESNCLSPVPTTLADFESAHYLTGQAVLDACGRRGREVAGFFKNAELSGFVSVATRAGVEPVPILSAWASSGGKLTLDCFETLEGRLVEGLRAAGPVDGCFLALHGAMGVDGVRDPETRLIAAARAAIGGGPVVATHDLHGNLTRERVEAADAIVAYQTNPHRDHARVGRRGGEILLGIARGEIRPTTAWRSLPMILGGGKTIDFLPPVRQVFRRMRQLQRRRQALSASTFMVHPWNDDPGLGWSTLVVTDGDQAAAERFAEELAELCWSVRHEQPPEFRSPAEAIAAARSARLRRRLGVVTMADASDVVTAGAPGDSTHLLRALIEDGAGLLSYAAVRDPVAAAELWTRAAGAEVDLEVGGRLDPQSSSPLRVRGRLLGTHDRPGFGKSAVLAIGDVRLVVTEGPAMVMRPSFYREVGLSPWKADVIMVKNFFPFLLFFLPMNRKTLFVRTRGATDFDAAFRLAFDGPVHPRDPVDDWRPRDRLRRGSSSPAPSPAASRAR